MRSRQRSARNMTAWPAELPPPTTATSAVFVQAGFDGGAGVVDAGALEAVGAFGGEAAPGDAGGREDDVGADDGAAVEMEACGGSFVGSGFEAIDGDGGDMVAPNLSIWRTPRVASSVPERPAGKPMKFSILAGAAGLAAGAEAIEDDGVKPSQAA